MASSLPSACHPAVPGSRRAAHAAAAAHRPRAPPGAGCSAQQCCSARQASHQHASTSSWQPTRVPRAAKQAPRRAACNDSSNAGASSSSSSSSSSGGSSSSSSSGGGGNALASARQPGMSALSATWPDAYTTCLEDGSTQPAHDPPHPASSSGHAIAPNGSSNNCSSSTSTATAVGSVRGRAWTYDAPHEAADAEAIRRLEQSRLARHTARATAQPPRPTVITSLPGHLSPRVLANALLLVDKPRDWSADEVAKSLTWALRSRRLGYVGHLEPLASGLMVVLLGQATSLTPQLHGVPQRFTGVMRMGIATDTHDACGTATATAPWAHVTDEQIEAACAELRGEIIQVPPAFMPNKQRSRPVYERATRRPQGELQPVAVRVTELSVRRLEPGGSELGFSVTFARYGHVRALAHDLGLALGCYAHVSALRREALGGFSVEDAWPLDVLLPTLRRFKPSVRRGVAGQ